MKTIRAIFTREKQDQPRGRAYSFNTELDVKVGDLLQSPDYQGKLLQVIGIEDEVYSHFSFRTGELKKAMESGCGIIKTLGIDTIVVNEEDYVKPEPEYEGF